MTLALVQLVVPLQDEWKHYQSTVLQLHLQQFSIQDCF